MNKPITEKYEAKLDFLNKALGKSIKFMDNDTHEMMSDLKTLLEEVVSDVRKLEQQAQTEEGSISFFVNKTNPILELKSNGDIFVKGKLTENDTKVVEALKDFLEASKINQ